jgi:hypothetical protein
VAEDVPLSGELCLSLIADEYGLVAPAPDLVSPVGQACGFLGEVALEVAHESSQLKSRVDREQKVVVIGHEDEIVQTNSVESLCATQCSENDAVEQSAGAKEEPTLNCACCDLDNGTVWRNEAESSRHVVERDEKPLQILAKRVEP